MFTCCICQPRDDCHALFDGGNVQMLNARKMLCVINAGGRYLDRDRLRFGCLVSTPSVVL